MARECLAARNGVAIMDASTLGKIDIQGPDAATLLNWVYTNAWHKLGVGRCRYGLMLDENGMVMDDGVTTRLGEQHFLMTTTTGGAARVMSWLERWLQTEWPHLEGLPHVGDRSLGDRRGRRPDEPQGACEAVCEGHRLLARGVSVHVVRARAPSPACRRA